MEVRRAIAWVGAALLALAFVASGLGKLMATEFNVEGFERWGYPMWFMYLVGLAEVAGGVALLLPRVSVIGASLRLWGAVILTLVMLGAVATHLAHAEYTMLPVPVVLLILAAALALSERTDAATYGA